jgi:hypothetical protein
VQLWVQDHLVPLRELGGPGGSITITPEPAVDGTTSTTSTNSPATLEGS